MTDRDRPTAPRPLRALARLVIRGRDAPAILGDLGELWTREVEGGARRWRASARYGANAVASAASLLRAGAAARRGRSGAGMSEGRVLAPFGRDLAIATRTLFKQRRFALAAVGTLSIGIGATTAIFSALNAVLLEPLPYRSPENVYAFTTPRADGRWSTGRVSHAYVAAVRESAPSVDQAVAVTVREETVSAGDGESRTVVSALVSEGFFDVFDVPMELGRGLSEEDYAAPTAVISTDVWRDLFGGRSDVVGRSLVTPRGDYTVVGVAPPSLDEPRAADVWITYGLIPTSLAHSFAGYLRTADGTDPAVLDSELGAVMAGLAERYPQAAEGRAFVTTPLLTSIVGDLGAVLIVVMVGAGLILLLACVNVSVLTLARGRTLRREVAVRTALGAGRSDLARGVCAESLVVAAAGTVGGVGVAWLCARLLARYGASELPRLAAIPFDLRVLGFAALGLITATLLTGSFRVARLWETDVRGVLGDGGRTASGGRGTNRALAGFVVVEVALAIVLVAGAGWMVRSYADLTRTELGFVPDRRLVFTAFLTGSQWAPRGIPVQGSEEWENDVAPGLSPAVWARAVRERIGASEQITAVGSGGTLPLGRDWEPAYYISVAGEAFDPDAAEGVQFRGVDPSFFDAVGTRLVAGRLFERDEPGVAVVNEAFVRRHLAGRDPLGATASFHFGFPTPDLDRPLAVVGVVEGAKYASVDADAEPTFYLPFSGATQAVVVETTLDDPTSLIPFVRAEVAAVDPGVPVTVVPYDDLVDGQLARRRVGLNLMSLFALVSVLMAAVGILGVVAYLTEERRRELATRVAFGASPADVRGLLLRPWARLFPVGAVVGVALTWLAGRLVSVLLPDLVPGDPAILLASISAVLLITLAAFLAPAMRAATWEPARGLGD